MLIVDEKQLQSIAFDFAKELRGKDIILLNGELGAGKTAFVSALAKGLEITEVVSSPTFSIIKEYENKLCHIDAYRIFDEDIDIEYYIDNNYIICIEWSENIINYIPYITYEINIEYYNDKRKIEMIKRDNK